MIFFKVIVLANSKGRIQTRSPDSKFSDFFFMIFLLANYSLDFINMPILIIIFYPVAKPPGLVA